LARQVPVGSGGVGGGGNGNETGWIVLDVKCAVWLIFSVLHCVVRSSLHCIITILHMSKWSRLSMAVNSFSLNYFTSSIVSSDTYLYNCGLVLEAWTDSSDTLKHYRSLHPTPSFLYNTQLWYRTWHPSSWQGHRMVRLRCNPGRIFGQSSACKICQFLLREHLGYIPTDCRGNVFRNTPTRSWTAMRTDWKPLEK
jgi:hypothetical protein